MWKRDMIGVGRTNSYAEKGGCHRDEQRHNEGEARTCGYIKGMLKLNQPAVVTLGFICAHAQGPYQTIKSEVLKVVYF
jgi:hypothetical protein